MEKKTVQKWCFVPGCKNTSYTTPNKIFVSVPREHTRRQKWFDAAKRDTPKSKSTFFCCEDHFKLEEDAQNFMKYKLMGGKIYMKPDVVPYLLLEGASTSARKKKVVQYCMAETDIPALPEVKSVGVQARPSYHSKSIICNVTSIGTSPIKFATSHSSTSTFAC